ncbi:MAG: hypothetical protein ACP6IY_09500 [Promethearchaeia archaeon]
MTLKCFGIYEITDNGLIFQSDEDHFITSNEKDLNDLKKAVDFAISMLSEEEKQ